MHNARNIISDLRKCFLNVAWKNLPSVIECAISAWLERDDETWGQQCVVKEIPCDIFLSVSYDDELLLSSDEWFICAYLAACMFLKVTTVCTAGEDVC